MKLLMTGILLVLAGICQAGEIITIDDFEYHDENALTSTWAPYEDLGNANLTTGMNGVGTAMNIPCPFSDNKVQRAAYDREITLDLSRQGAINFDFYTSAPEKIQGCTLYFRSGEGWYAYVFNADLGWQHYSVGKGAFAIEGEPAGWSKIDGIRISVWKGAGEDTNCIIDNLAAETMAIALVRGISESDETTGTVAQRMDTWLNEYGVRHGMITDKDITDETLAGHKIIIIGYSPELSEASIAALEKFIAAGGKLISFYVLPDQLAKLLGVTKLEYHGQLKDELTFVKLDNTMLKGAPEQISQSSWNANIITPGENAQVVGQWTDLNGAVTGDAVVINQNGAYMGHILTENDEGAKRLFLLSLIGQFAPEVWREAADKALAGSILIGPYRNREQLITGVREQTPAPRKDAVEQHLGKAEVMSQEIQNLYDAGNYSKVLSNCEDLRNELVDAYMLSQPSTSTEFRAVWNHSGTGDCGTWDEAMRRLAAANFNAVIPNMWWGGVAHYDSKLLPHSDTFTQHGDQIAQAVEAGKKYGIEVHAWKVNYNLDTAPDDFVAQMRNEGRLQHDYKGAEIRWLCPSNPANKQLELDTMLEVALNYDVAGIHFDYIRYNDETGCYCDGCREQFEKVIGHKVENWPDDCWEGELRQAYRDWRCENINWLVQHVSEELRRVRPQVKLSAAVWPEWPNVKDYIGQDWMLWVEKGWLDFVCPMDYSDNFKYFENLVSRQVANVNNRIPMYVGIGQWINPDDQTVSQVVRSRELGADGFVMFNMGAGLSLQTLPRMLSGATATPAVMPHKAPTFMYKMLPTLVAGEFVAEVTVIDYGIQKQPVTSITGVVELQDMHGNTLERLGVLPEAGQSLIVHGKQPAGSFAVAIVGDFQFEDGTNQRFSRRISQIAK